MYVVATAGHVDHGKSALVRALTGMEPDRWAEERRRGMTIDLGYAWTSLPCGDVAFVDVPGHKRFIANMLAGVGPAPAVVFVVAADEGWSAQSEEHLRAVDALGVTTGVLAVTRSDLADPSAALAGATARLARSSLRGARSVAVSAVTGRGLDDLRAALSAALSEQPPPAGDGDARLWVDRVFTIGGSGTVVTGTLAGGALRVGDEVEVAPGGVRARVRALEVLKERQREVRPVARVAVNLRGLSTEDVRRGDALVRPGTWYRTALVDARLVAPDGRRPPRELRLHVGSAAVEVVARPLGADHVRLALRAPLPLRAGDRGVLHDPGARGVVGGVLVVDADPPPLARRGGASARATDVAGMTGVPDPAGEVARRGVVAVALLRALGVDVEWPDVPDVVPAGPWLVSAARWREWVGAAGNVVDDYAARNAADPAMPLEHLRAALGVPDPRTVARVLAEVPGLDVSHGRVARTGARDAGRGAVDEVRRRLAAEPFRPPTRDELAGLGLADAALAAAVRDGLLVRISRGAYLCPESVDLAVGLLAALPAPFTAAEARDALGTTRRVVIPLLEHLDATRRTTRRPDGRRDVRG